jgi:hypothetical protein
VGYSLRVCDLRISSNQDHAARLMSTSKSTDGSSTSPGGSAYFNDIVVAMSDVKFINPNSSLYHEFKQSSSSLSSGSHFQPSRFVLSRDYLSLRVWDMTMERSPIIEIPVHDYLRPHLSGLYDNDCLFDKFRCGISNDGS